MDIGSRLREIREFKGLSQGDVEHRTGLLRCYISRVENGHTVPSIETLEKLSRALEILIYQLFYDGNEEPATISPASNPTEPDWASRGKGLRLFGKLRQAAAKMNGSDRDLLLSVAKAISQKKHASRARTRAC